MPYYRNLLSLTICLTCFQVMWQTVTPGNLPGSVSKVRVCVPNRTALLQHPPLYIIKSHNKELKSKNSIVLNMLNPQEIKNFNVLKDSVTTAEYGDDAVNGVVLITLDDEKYPDAYKTLKKSLKNHNKQKANL